MLSCARNVEECTKIHNCETNLIFGEGVSAPPEAPPSWRPRHLCSLCPTHFLVPSGAYEGHQPWCQSKAHNMGLHIMDFLLVIIVTLAVLLPFSRYLRLKIENSWLYPPLPCLTPPARGSPLEFLDETYPAKTRGVGLLYGKNFIILTSTVFL